MSFQHPDSLADRDAPPRALVEALREEPIDAIRMQNAYLHFLQRRAAASPWWRARGAVRWAAVAVVVGASSVYAATLIRPFSSSSQLTDPVATTVVPTSVPKESAPDADAAREADAGSQQDGFGTDAGRDDAGRDADVSSPGTMREQPARSPTPTPSAEQWKRAAKGLRDGDFQSANAALKELTRRGTEADRESAQLVQAQVLLAQGKDAEAGSLLKSLEASAHAPSVRRKSTELLARLRDRAAPRAPKSRSGTELR